MCGEMIALMRKKAIAVQGGAKNAVGPCAISNAQFRIGLGHSTDILHDFRSRE